MPGPSTTLRIHPVYAFVAAFLAFLVGVHRAITLFMAQESAIWPWIQVVLWIVVPALLVWWVYARDGYIFEFRTQHPSGTRGRGE